MQVKTQKHERGDLEKKQIKKIYKQNACISQINFNKSVITVKTNFQKCEET
jgi:hypothetical protein